MHSSRGHTPLEFMVDREIPILLDVMIGPKAMRGTTVNLSVALEIILC